MYIDSHCHLEGPRFERDRPAVLQRAAAAGVEALLAIGNGSGPGTFECGIRLAEEHGRGAAPPRLYTTIGIHPHEAKVADDDALRELARLAQHPSVIAWGEIGLDYWYDHSPREVQRSVFVRQMELARAARKPIIIHCRGSRQNPEDAWNDVVHLLQLNWSGNASGGILHCFTGTLKHMQSALDLGFLISFAGNVTFPGAEAIRDAARQAPLDRMLIETDSPYLAPVPYRGRRNEPAYVTAVAECVAGACGMTGEEIGRATAQNFHRFFQLD